MSCLGHKYHRLMFTDFRKQKREKKAGCKNDSTKILTDIPECQELAALSENHKQKASTKKPKRCFLKSNLKSKKLDL
ncbi:Hypothetical predicted protein [Octopus vulgaris]|uniref:Uncharacterized protein n=1 Tax=Octopus vulgaris TaxID=6645 RepID=A0AA36F146_OCTVU|nr:Hypothetical predicted protein [Octopus vulgaris]